MRIMTEEGETIAEIRIGAKKLKSSNMNSTPPQAEPDPDTIKMFVGQIPRSMDENDLRKMFEEFGPIYQLNVLRDKVTGQSKGCCFVTFYTRKAALAAQNALHNMKTMTGMQHPIQMKPADSEKRNEERKLFIGMLTKKYVENDVRMMFAPFGQIEECTVLREQNGQSKGCAFVTYASKQCATNAIKSMHHSQTMEGCRAPLVAKFADTQKEKEMKKLQHQFQSNASLLGMANLMGGLGSLNPQYLALLQQAGQGQTGNVGGASGLGNVGSGLNALQTQQILTAAAAAATALQNNPGLATALASLNTTLAGLSNSSSATGGILPSSPHATRGGSPPLINSQGDVNSLQNLQNLQSLAALAAIANPGSSPGGSLGNMGNMATSAQNLAALQQLAAATSSNGGATALPSMGNTGGLTATSTPNSMSGLGSFQNSLSNMAAASMVGGFGTGNVNGLGNTAPTTPTNAGQTSVDATLSQAYSGIQQYAGLSSLLGQASFPNAFGAQTTTQQLQAAANSPAGKQTEGPEGANLFIYHLPQEFGDHDLMQMFMPFGNVVSAKVFIDKQTNLSKCFGFVSYDNPLSAQAAIQAMNGFQIGMKRLKVQLKRPKSESKPY